MPRSARPPAHSPAGDRARLLLRLADLLERRADELVEAECRNTGKPAAAMRAGWARHSAVVAGGTPLARDASTTRRRSSPGYGSATS